MNTFKITNYSSNTQMYNHHIQKTFEIQNFKLENEFLK